MSRLEKFNELAELEERKDVFEKVLADMENYYFRSGTIKFDLESDNYNSKYQDETIPFNSGLAKIYIESEIQTIDDKINRILEGFK